MRYAFDEYDEWAECVEDLELESELPLIPPCGQTLISREWCDPGVMNEWQREVDDQKLLGSQLDKVVDVIESESILRDGAGWLFADF